MDFLNKISVKFRITALFIIFLVFFALFGLFTIKQIKALGDLTRIMFEHPLQVSVASLHAKSGVLRMHRGMKDVSMATTQMGINIAIQTVQDEEKNVYKNLKIVKKRILGAKGEKLVQETIEMFAGWKPIRIEVEELVLKGNREAAGKITRHTGADYVTKLERQMEELTDYAHAKAENFMDTADESQQQTTVMVAVCFCVAATVCLFLSLIVIHSIIKSLGLLKDQMVTITSTKAMTPVEILGNNEITVLASHFNALISAIKDQFWLRNNIDKINRELGGDLSSDEMTDKCISIIARNINACAGAFYLFDNQNNTCNLASSYAFIEKDYFARSFSLGEGIIGQVAKEKKPILLENISRNDACTDTGTVSEPPVSIYVVPIQYNMKLLAIMEVASFVPINEIKKQFIDEAAGAVASLLNNSLQNTKIRELFDKSQASNDVLQAQSSEINAQNDELNAINKELQAQAEELQAQTSELETKRIQVEEADRLKSEFLSNMSHELRTPLNSIMSLSQLMISRGVNKEPDTSLKYLNVIDRNSRQLLNLINDILDLTKIESGRMDIFPTRFETSQLVERIMETVQPLAQKKNLRMEIDVANALPLFSDEEKLYQILLNCCSNAIKFTNEGVIRLTVRETGGTTSFSVKDTGIGIPAENIENIFDQFRQVDGSLTRAHEGTGLGLAISRKLALLLGGSIKVESTLGTGSTFTLKLPTNASGYPIQEKNRDIVAEHNIASFMRKPGTSILVIDDEEDARAILSKYLKDGGYNVISAGNGKQGLEIAQTAQPDIICLDLLMPDMDGWEVLQNLKSTPETVGIPVIISSISKVKDTGWALGVAGYVPKPVHNATLLEEIQRLSGTKAGARLLIADDNIDVLEFLKEFLGNKGYVIETADNGQKALEMIAVSPPQLLILDLLMPDIDGFSVLDQLRKSPETQDLPVIILTAKDLTENDFQRLATSFKTIRKDKLNRENFLYQVKIALEGYDRSTLNLDTPPTSNQILVVDDNDIASEQIAAALMDSGFDVVIAKNGQEGLAHVQQNIPAGIVLDLMMPKIDGFEVLEQIRSRPQTATLPVLILTAKELTTVERGRLTHNNVQQLIQKGTADREQLVSSVKRMLSHAKDMLVKPLSDTIAANTRSILLIEDNPDNQLTISAILEEDAELLVAEDGEKGVQIATEKIPNLILMDIQLPVMSGLEAIKILKDNPATDKIPIIVVTARAMKGDKENVLAAGADDYISKPINPAELQEKVRKWMS